MVPRDDIDDVQRANTDNQDDLMGSSNQFTQPQVKKKGHSFHSPSKKEIIKKYSMAKSKGLDLHDLERDFLKREQELLSDLQYVMRL